MQLNVYVTLKAWRRSNCWNVLSDIDWQRRLSIPALAKRKICCHSLALRSSNCSNVLSDTSRQCGRVIIRAELKSRSTAAEDGRTALCCTKSFFTSEYLFSISKSFLLSPRNCSTSRSHLFVVGLWCFSESKVVIISVFNVSLYSWIWHSSRHLTCILQQQWTDYQSSLK